MNKYTLFNDADFLFRQVNMAGADRLIITHKPTRYHLQIPVGNPEVLSKFFEEVKRRMKNVAKDL